MSANQAPDNGLLIRVSTSSLIIRCISILRSANLYFFNLRLFLLGVKGFFSFGFFGFFELQRQVIIGLFGEIEERYSPWVESAYITLAVTQPLHALECRRSCGLLRHHCQQRDISFENDAWLGVSSIPLALARLSSAVVIALVRIGLVGLSGLFHVGEVGIIAADPFLSILKFLVIVLDLFLFLSDFALLFQFFLLFESPPLLHLPVEFILHFSSFSFEIQLLIIVKFFGE